MIQIITEKVVERGIQCRKIIKIKALEKKDLPTEYIEGGDKPIHCYLRKFSKIAGDPGTELRCSEGIDLVVNNIYIEERIQERLAFIHRCGERLGRINKALKEKNKNWHGEETFCI